MTADMEVTPVEAIPTVVVGILAEGTLVGATVAAGTEGQKMEFICTFGFGHLHPVTKKSLGNHYIVVNAEDEVEAHKVMYRRFGQKWAFCYKSREDAGVDRFDLVELVDDQLYAMKEAGVVIDMDDKICYEHTPEGRTAGSIPDSSDLWDQLWNRRSTVKGFAHSHPGGGTPSPSHTDLTTFAAVEAGLGRRLSWWITSDCQLIVLRWIGPDRLTYEAKLIANEDEPEWVDRLREISYNEVENEQRRSDDQSDGG
jgi:JAB domain-containing protein similar to deubiquitination enzymes